MKCVYRAGNILEAHVVQGVLAQYRISGFIQGEFSVAGAGELAPQQGTDLWVNYDDYPQAKNIVREYELANTSEVASTKVARHLSISSLSAPSRLKWLYLAAGLMIFVEVVRFFTL